MHDTKLVHEPVEAWKYGPVFPSLYYALRGFGGGDIPYLTYCNTKLNDVVIDDRLGFLRNLLGEESKIVDMVIDTYGSLSGRQLIEITHKKGTPWYKFYRKDRHGIIIPTEEIRAHYQEIIDGGS